MVNVKKILEEGIKRKEDLYPTMLGVLVGMIQCNSTNEELKKAVADFDSFRSTNFYLE